MDLSNVPERLRNGQALPKSFTDICDEAGGIPKYKIVVSCNDHFDKNYRINHSYYIGVMKEDPSFIQKLMSTKSLSHFTGYENGQSIENMMVYKFKSDTNNMIYFNGMISRIVNENNKNYVLCKYYTKTQYCNDSSDDEIVMWYIDYS